LGQKYQINWSKLYSNGLTQWIFPTKNSSIVLINCKTQMKKYKNFIIKDLQAILKGNYSKPSPIIRDV